MRKAKRRRNALMSPSPLSPVPPPTELQTLSLWLSEAIYTPSKFIRAFISTFNLFTGAAARRSLNPVWGFGASIRRKKIKFG